MPDLQLIETTVQRYQGVFTLLTLESESFENNMLHSFRRPAERQFSCAGTG